MASAEAFDSWLRQPANRFNPGTTADLVTAALYAALRDGTIPYPFTRFGDDASSIAHDRSTMSKWRS